MRNSIISILSVFVILSILVHPGSAIVLEPVAKVQHVNFSIPSDENVEILVSVDSDIKNQITTYSSTATTEGIGYERLDSAELSYTYFDKNQKSWYAVISSEDGSKSTEVGTTGFNQITSMKPFMQPLQVSDNQLQPTQYSALLSYESDYINLISTYQVLIYDLVSANVIHEYNFATNISVLPSMSNVLFVENTYYTSIILSNGTLVNLVINPNNSVFVSTLTTPYSNQDSVFRYDLDNALIRFSNGSLANYIISESEISIIDSIHIGGPLYMVKTNALLQIIDVNNFVSRLSIDSFIIDLSNMTSMDSDSSTYDMSTAVTTFGGSGYEVFFNQKWYILVHYKLASSVTSTYEESIGAVKIDVIDLSSRSYVSDIIIPLDSKNSTSDVPLSWTYQIFALCLLAPCIRRISCNRK